MTDIEDIGHPSSLNEVAIVQNPALGAVLLWRFSICYEKSSGFSGVPMPLLFVVLPILLNEYTRDIINSTYPSSGLHKFSLKMLKRKEELLSIHSRMLRLRVMTLKCISLAVDKNLLQISVADGLITNNKSTISHILPKKILALIKGADKLGGWCGALELSEIENYLRVRF
jgi:hypothetical protein